MKLHELTEETKPDYYLIHAYLRGDDGEDGGDEHADMRYELEDVIEEHGGKVLRETNGGPLVWEIKVPAEQIDNLYSEMDDHDLVISLYTNEHHPFEDDPFKSAVEKMTDDPELLAKIAKRKKK